MKKFDVIWRGINTVIIIAILAVVILLYKKAYNCCNCNEKKKQLLILRTADTYDSITHQKGTHVWIDTLTLGQQGNSDIVIWNNCPEKIIKKVFASHKKYSGEKKINQIISQNESVEITPVLKDTLPCPQKEDLHKPKMNNSDNFNTLSLEVNLSKRYHSDVPISLVHEELPLNLNDLFSTKINSLVYSNQYTEYLPNPYRDKVENSFWTAISLGVISVGCYSISEKLGDPKFYDDRDNSSAQKKHDQILVLRTASTIFGLGSVFEFGRTAYFHNMESRFIINPTEIKLTVKPKYK